jgi:hypothetical protein
MESLPLELRDSLDAIWESYEPELPGAVRALAERRTSPADLAALHIHVACTAVRLPGFPERLQGLYKRHGSEVTKEQAQLARFEWIQRGLDMDKWCWRALHMPDDVRTPFLLADTGFAKFRTPDRPDRELLFLPLGPRVGLLGVRPDQGMPAGFRAIEHRQVMWSTANLLNRASALAEDRTILVTHPSRRKWLETIATTWLAPEMEPFSHGPYRSRNEDWF